MATIDLIAREREHVIKQLAHYEQHPRTVQKGLVVDLGERIVRAVYAGLNTSEVRPYRIRQLIQAAALICAEVERLQGLAPEKGTAA